VPSTIARGPRLVGLDRLRGAALLLMLVHHLTKWFGTGARGVIPGWERFAVTDVAAVAFTVALGASVPMMLAARARRGQSGWRLAGTVLRRYGLLIPIGWVLRLALGFDMGRVGVLETLGITALLTAVVVRLVPRAIPGVALVVLLAAPAAERAAEGLDHWLLHAALAGTFPLAAYLAFALVGAACAPLLGHRFERPAAVGVSAIGVAWTAALIAAGEEPARYAGDARFLVPGLTGTALLYLAMTSPRLDASRVGDVIRRAGAHTFGIFIGHYIAFFVLRELGLLPDLPDALALTLAVVASVALALVAPLVPTLPWSPRTGWARPRTAPPVVQARPAPNPKEPVAGLR
jgi:peptidoglycan/LPS O-acetylase OafA/YrhL